MRLLRIQKIAEKYNLSLGTLYRWHSAGRFPGLFYKLSRVLLIDEDELLRLAGVKNPETGKGNEEHTKEH